MTFTVMAVAPGCTPCRCSFSWCSAFCHVVSVCVRVWGVFVLQAHSWGMYQAQARRVCMVQAQEWGMQELACVQGGTGMGCVDAGVCVFDAGTRMGYAVQA